MTSATRILVVDDERDAADALAAALSAPDREIVTVYHWAGALEAFFKLRPHVCLVDIGIPELDGHYIARTIRAAPKIATPLMIAVTARTGPAEVARSLNAGFQHHVAKPAYAKDIEALIDRHFGFHSQGRPEA